VPPRVRHIDARDLPRYRNGVRRRCLDHGARRSER
jgi:hypothetical protein